MDETCVNTLNHRALNFHIFSNVSKKELEFAAVFFSYCDKPYLFDLFRLSDEKLHMDFH